MNNQFYNKYLEECISYMDNADHLINVSFKTIPDPKIILCSLNNMVNSFRSGFKWVGNWSYYTKNINFLPKNENDFFDLFSNSLSHQFSFNNNCLESFFDIKKLVDSYSDSYMMFKKNDSIVICNNTKDSFKSFTIKDVDKLLKQNKAFVKNMLCLKQEDINNERISC